MKIAFHLASLLIAFLILPAAAADRQPGLRTQLKQATLARELAEQERAAALADREALERELVGLREKAAAAEGPLAAERAERERAERERDALLAERDGLRNTLAAAEQAAAGRGAALRDAQQAVARADAARQIAETDLAARGERLRACAASNADLAELAHELIGAYRTKSCMDALKQSEPFAGVRKLEIENLIDTWRVRVDAGVVDAPTAP